MDYFGQYREEYQRQTGFAYRTATTSITAFAGGGAGSAVPLTSHINRVSTVATDLGSVKLPVAVAGLDCVVINSGAKVLNVFGAGSDTINGAASQGLLVGAAQMYTCPANGIWLALIASSILGAGLYSNITTNATTVVKASAGYLSNITVNDLGVGTTATIYDNTAASGTVIATLNTALSVETFTYGVSFATGLTVLTAGGAAANLTLSYT